MPGLLGRGVTGFGNYLGGIGHGALGMAGPMQTAAGAVGLQHLGLARMVAKTPAGMGALIGAGVGAQYGAFSDNASIMGGMATGAMLGGMAGGLNRPARMYAAKMLANKPFHRIRGMFR